MTASRPPEPHARPYPKGANGMLGAFIGKPFAAGGHGPDAYDCWGLVHAAARDLFGLHFPMAVYASMRPPAIAAAADRMLAAHTWQERAQGDTGRVMALAGYDGRVCHVGLCLDATRVLHITRVLRSCVMPAHKLAALYPVARYYAWAH